MTTALEKKQDGTLQLTITIPNAMVKKTWAEVVDETTKEANIPGFRKGKAPKNLVEEKLDKEKVREEVLKKLLPQAYIEAVKEHNLKPIMNPKIHVSELAEDKDWQFSALTAEAPVVILGDYKKKIRDITAKSKIVIPGKEEQKVNFDEIVQALVENVKIEIPQLLIEQEVDKLLAQTLDEIKSLGLSLEQYLGSTKKTAEDLRKEYTKKAATDITLEFALAKVAEVENITVEQKEVEEAIQKAKDDAERKNLEANKYLLASILRQQKTLDFLRNL